MFAKDAFNQRLRSTIRAHENKNKVSVICQTNEIQYKITKQ